MRFIPPEILNLNLFGSLACNRFFVTKGFACGNVRIVSCSVEVPQSSSYGLSQLSDQVVGAGV